MSSIRETSVPTDDELIYLGFEEWQVALVRKLSPDMQWVAHDEYIRRLMLDGDVDNTVF
jgi:hypothetical protein